MKYYVYAGYYENFISGHKLPKPYTLRDEFKTFDEALDYVWENWEDDDIFFTEDVIGDAIDNGFINDENWEDYLMEESKKSARKSIKIGDVVKNENRDDLFGLVYEVKGGRITMYPIDKDTHTYDTRFPFGGNAIDYEVVNFKVTPMEESKKSARKSIKESRGQDELVELCNVKESKSSTRKSLKESVEFSKEKDIYIAQIKDSSISFAYTPIDTDNDFNGYFVFDGDDVIEYLNWKGADANDMLKAFNDFEKAVKKYSSKEDAKIIIKDFHDKLGI